MLEEELKEKRNERGRMSMLQKWATPATLVSILYTVFELALNEVRVGAGE